MKKILMNKKLTKSIIIILTLSIDCVSTTIFSFFNIRMNLIHDQRVLMVLFRDGVGSDYNFIITTIAAVRSYPDYAATLC